MFNYIHRKFKSSKKAQVSTALQINSKVIKLQASMWSERSQIGWKSMSKMRMRR
jgi:hypothetical protein